MILSVVLLLLLSPQKAPHWVLQITFTIVAFTTSITWLNIIANEVISILQTFGILFDINTAILGLTILAAGNSMADLVADTVIARAGRPEMAFACCFGSPLLSNVLGLGIAFTVRNLVPLNLIQLMQCFCSLQRSEFHLAIMVTHIR